jgi:hypothetical protein
MKSRNNNMAGDLLIFIWLAITIFGVFSSLNDFDRARIKLKGGRRTQSKTTRARRRKEDSTDILEDYEDMEEELKNHGESW